MIQSNFMDDLTRILNYLITNKKRFKKEYHIIKIGVFGSIARNEQNNKSDIDLIVEFEENTQNLFDLKEKIKQEFRNKFNRPVDICREKYIKPIFKEQILSQVHYA